MITIHNVVSGKVRTGELQDLKREGFSWGDCINPDEKDFEILEKFTKIPKKIIIDGLSARERPKAIPTKAGSVVIINAPIKTAKGMRLTPVVMLILKKEVITVHNYDVIAINELLSQN